MPPKKSKANVQYINADSYTFPSGIFDQSQYQKFLEQGVNTLPSVVKSLTNDIYEDPTKLKNYYESQSEEDQKHLDRHFRYFSSHIDENEIMGLFNDASTTTNMVLAPEDVKQLGRQPAVNKQVKDIFKLKDDWNTDQGWDRMKNELTKEGIMTDQSIEDYIISKGIYSLIPKDRSIIDPNMRYSTLSKMYGRGKGQGHIYQHSLIAQAINPKGLVRQDKDKDGNDIENKLRNTALHLGDAQAGFSLPGYIYGTGDKNHLGGGKRNENIRRENVVGLVASKNAVDEQNPIHNFTNIETNSVLKNPEFDTGRNSKDVAKMGSLVKYLYSNKGDAVKSPKDLWSSDKTGNLVDLITTKVGQMYLLGSKDRGVSHLDVKKLNDGTSSYLDKKSKVKTTYSFKNFKNEGGRTKIVYDKSGGGESEDDMPVIIENGQFSHFTGKKTKTLPTWNDYLRDYGSTIKRWQDRNKNPPSTFDMEELKKLIGEETKRRGDAGEFVKTEILDPTQTADTAFMSDLKYSIGAETERRNMMGEAVQPPKILDPSKTSRALRNNYIQELANTAVVNLRLNKK